MAVITDGLWASKVVLLLECEEKRCGPRRKRRRGKVVLRVFGVNRRALCEDDVEVGWSSLLHVSNVLLG